MAYLPTIPAATDKLSTSQSQIQANFTAIDDGATAGFAYDHVGLTEVSDVGKHKSVTLVEPAAAPTIGANELGVYAEDVGGETHLFYKNSSTSVDLTIPGVGSAGGVSTFSRNLTQLFTGGASNLIFKTGQTSASAIAQDASTTVTYPVTFPVATAHVVVTALFASASGTKIVNLTLVSFTATGFTVRMDSVGSAASGACDLHFFAIGR